MSRRKPGATVIGGSGGLGSPAVATAYLPTATGLGVMLTNHAIVRSAIVRRIAPDARFFAARCSAGSRRCGAARRTIAFAPRGGGAWPPGVYAITVRWTDAVGCTLGLARRVAAGPGRDSVLAR